MTPRPIGALPVLAIVLGLAALSSAALTSRFALAGAAVLFAALLLTTTSLSNAGRIARGLRPLTGREVRVEVWGAPLAVEASPPLRIDSVGAFGVGLLIYLRTGDAARRSLLKVAQPREQVVTGSGVRIGAATYVSWDGRKLPRPTVDAPALALTAAGAE